MIVKRLHTFKIFIVVLFLAAFSNVFVCDFLCDVGIIDIGLDNHHHEEIAHRGDSNADHHHGERGHHDNDDPHKLIGDLPAEAGDGHGNHDHHSNHHKPITSGHHHDSEDQDDCCEEETNALFSSLIKHQKKPFDLEPNYFQLAEILFPSEIIDHFLNVDLLGDLYFLDLPPPSSWDIRIFIQSFLN